MLNAQTGNMLSIFTDTLNNAAGRELVLGPGTFLIDAANPALPLTDYTRIRGMGRGNTIIEFRNLSSSSHGFSASQKVGIRIADLTIKHTTALTGNQNAVNFDECNDCLLENVDQINFSGGFWFVRSGGTSDTWNLRNKAFNCVSRNSSSYGLHILGGTACEWHGCEAYNATSQDGFKTGGNSRFLRISHCYAKGNAQDGFDTYDGFISSTMSECIAEGNNLAGFQVKGTLSGDYVSRDSSISNCVASGNGLNGFLFQETRALSLSNLVSSENGAAGFVFNNTQSLSCSSLTALRNTEDGFSVIGNSSYNTFAACTAQDNSYTDGTEQTGTYHGFHIESGGSNTFAGCQSYNGNQVGKEGGQGYGFKVEAGQEGNVFSACRAVSNVTDNTIPA